MEGKRLIVPRKSHHHRRRAVTFMVVGLLAVAGVWGLQMKVTFSDFAQRPRQNNVFARTGEQLEEGLAAVKPSDETIVEVGAFARQIQATLEAAQAVQTEQVAAEDSAAPTTDTAASGEGAVAAFPPAVPEGVVAGAQTEASN